jgi:hypothetical protein
LPSHCQAGTDLAPLLKGLANNLSACPHWGYVIEGHMRMSYADGQEVLRAVIERNAASAQPASAQVSRGSQEMTFKGSP